MKKIYLGIAALLVVIASASLTMGYFWDSQNNPQGFFNNDHEKIPVLGSQTNEYFNQGEPLRWLQIVAPRSEKVPAEILAFTLSGIEVTTFEANEEYFLVDKQAYRSFVPTTFNDVVRLQLPNTSLMMRNQYAAFVRPASEWTVPADVPNKLDYTVSFRDKNTNTNHDDAQAGEVVNNVFTLWIVPEAEKQNSMVVIRPTL